MKEIGGYFELMLPKMSGHYHRDALRLNTAGNAFRLLLSAYGDKYVYMPNYICDSMITPLAELGVDYSFYPVNKHLEAEMLPALGPGERFLYVNYFGVKDKYVKALSRRYRDKLIVDNTQSFFSAHEKMVDSVYSARKFFGVPDGAYWYPSREVSQSLLPSFRHPIVTMGLRHLVGRLEDSANDHYQEYLEYEKEIESAPVAGMSHTSEMMLQAIDYSRCRNQLISNFRILHERLGRFNELPLSVSLDGVPMAYPLLTKVQGVRESLVRKRVYVTRLWREVYERPSVSAEERYLVDYLIPLPIDQRYGRDDMNFIASIIEKVIKKQFF